MAAIQDPLAHVTLPRIDLGDSAVYRSPTDYTIRIPYYAWGRRPWRWGQNGPESSEPPNERRKGYTIIHEHIHKTTHQPVYRRKNFEFKGQRSMKYMFKHWDVLKKYDPKDLVEWLTYPDLLLTLCASRGLEGWKLYFKIRQAAFGLTDADGFQNPEPPADPDEQDIRDEEDVASDADEVVLADAQIDTSLQDYPDYRSVVYPLPGGRPHYIRAARPARPAVQPIGQEAKNFLEEALGETTERQLGANEQGRINQERLARIASHKLERERKAKEAEDEEKEQNPRRVNRRKRRKSQKEKKSRRSRQGKRAKKTPTLEDVASSIETELS